MLLILNQNEKVVAVLNNNSPEACPYWIDNHIESLNDSLSSYVFESPLQHESSEHLISDNYVARSDMDGNYILFKIKVVDEISTNGTYIKKVYSENAAISELNGAIIRPTVLTGYTADNALDYILNGTMWKRGECDFLGVATLPFDDYPTVLAGLHTLNRAFDGELVYRVTFKSGRLNRYIDLVEQRGQNTGKRFEYHKDITGLTRIQNSTNIATALIGLGKADSKGVRMNFASINSGLDWVGDDEALDRYGLGLDGQDGYHIFGVYEDNEAENPVDLLSRTRKALVKSKNPNTTYDIGVLLLETLSDWSHEAVRIGDNIEVLDLTFTPEVVLSARVISLERSYTDPTKDRAILGEFIPLTLSVPSAVRQMQKTLVANEGMIEGKELAIHVDNAPPEDINRKWMDTSVIPNIIKRYDGTTWVNASATSFVEIADLGGKLESPQIAIDAIKTEHLTVGAVTGDKIVDDAIKTEHITIGAVTSNKIVDDAITSLKIALGAINHKHIEPFTIDSGAIKNGAIVSAALADLAITQDKLAVGSVANDKIQDDAITALKIAAGQVKEAQLAVGAVTSFKIQDDAITALKIANDAVTSLKIAPNAITAPKIADNAVSVTKILDGAIAEAKLAAGSVTAIKVGTGAITNSKLADLAIDAAKLATGAVTTTKIANNAIDSSKIVDNAITQGKIAPGSVGTNQIETGAIQEAKMNWSSHLIF